MGCRAVWVRQDRQALSHASCLQVGLYLKERLELRRDVVGVLDRVPYNVMDEGVNGICIEGWLTHKEFV